MAQPITSVPMTSGQEKQLVRFIADAAESAAKRVVADADFLYSALTLQSIGQKTLGPLVFRQRRTGLDPWKLPRSDQGFLFVLFFEK